MKLKKFQVVKYVIESIADDYKTAKENNDIEVMDELNKQYSASRDLLWSNYAHFKNNVDVVKLNTEINDDNVDEHTKEQNKIKLYQKTLYTQNRKNKQFINIVEKSENIDDFIKNNSKKKVNFVKRNFDRFALGAAACTALAFVAVGCSNSKEDTKQTSSIVSTQSTDNVENTTENITTEIIKEENTQEVTKNNVDDLLGSLYVKLNSLPEEYDKDFIINGNNSDNSDKNNKENKNINVNSGEAIIKYNNEQFKKQEKIEALDPHVTNDNSSVTTTTIVNEKTATEKTPVDYKNKVINNTDKNKEEKVIVEEKHENVTVNVENLPIDGVEEDKPVDYNPITKDEDFIPTKEKVTIIGVEEKEDMNWDIEIEEENTLKQVQENKEVNKPTQENKTKEEIVIVEEKEENVEINTDNLPIEGLAKPKALVYRI